jgi:hypothetical protein
MIQITRGIRGPRARISTSWGSDAVAGGVSVGGAWSGGSGASSLVIGIATRAALAEDASDES